MSDLESSRTNTIRPRNAGLAAVQTSFRFVQRVLAIPAKKALHPVLRYPSEQELRHLLAHVDRTARHEERDCVLLSVLCDTGARIPGLPDLESVDFHLDAPPFVR
jgi:hypothetical protein